jgi:Gram-negative bacterial TonB protein C-terminal
MIKSAISLDHTLVVPAPVASNAARRICLLGSAAIHAGLLVLVAFGPRPLPSVRRPIYESEIRPHESKIIWYRKVPDIIPNTPISNLDHPQGELKSNQTIIARLPQPISSRQLVLQPAPQIKLEQDLPTPNLIAVTVPPPRPPEPKQAKPFIAPPAPAKRREPDPLLTEPSLVLTWTEPNGLDHSLTVLRPKAQPFVAPKREARKLTSLEPVHLEAAPELGPVGAAHPNGLAGLAPQNKLPSRPFTPPPGRASSGRGSGEPSLESPPNLPAGSNLNAAIIGLHPTDKEIPIPAGSRPAQFSTAPTVGEAATGDVHGAGGSAIPGLLVREGKDVKDERTNSPAPPPATTRSSRLVLYDDLVPGAVRPALSAGLQPASRSIPRALESRFQGRLVYALVIPAPNLPGYAGDWILWFAEIARMPGDVPLIQAPIPYRKTEFADSTRTPSADHSEARIQLAGVIQPDGRVDSITLLRGQPASICQSAIADLKRWEFRPATRGGSPIGVEVVIEIPFSVAWLRASQ